MLITWDSLMIFWEPKDLNSSTSLALPSTAHTSSRVGSGQLHSTPSTILSGHTIIMTSPIYCIRYSNYGCTVIGGLSLNLYHMLSRLRFFPWSSKFTVNFKWGSTFTNDFWSLFWETLTLTHSAKHQLLPMTPFVPAKPLLCGKLIPIATFVYQLEMWPCPCWTTVSVYCP